MRAEKPSPPDEDDKPIVLRRHDALWGAIARELEPSEFRRGNWLDRCELADFDGQFVLGARTTFARDHVEQKYGAALRSMLKRKARERGITYQGLDIVAPPAPVKRQREEVTA